MVMWRRAELNLAAWLQDSKRKPLVIRGARQVGKSTLVRQFARSQGLRLAEVNLEKWGALREIFQTKNVRRILEQIEFVLERPIRLETDLLFLDEIQAIPEAYASLRYFHEDLPRLPVMGAGSLLEVMLSESEISMPVGRVLFLSLGPMTFFEFLKATGQETLYEALERADLASVSKVLHESALSEYWKFLFLGGMPEVVARWIEKRDLLECRDIQRNILETYQADFGKYRKRIPQLRLERIFEYASRNVGRKVKYTEISRDDQARDLKPAIELLEKARVLTRVFHSNATRIPLGATKEEKIFKFLFLDVGLLGAALGMRSSDYQNRSRVNPVLWGQLAEQFVGQHFVGTAKAGIPEVFYWLREGKSQNAEVDFLLQSGTEIMPVECKAGIRGSNKSLVQFVGSTGASRAIRFDLNRPSSQDQKLLDPHGKEVELKLLTFPIYLCEKWELITQQQ